MNGPTAAAAANACAPTSMIGRPDSGTAQSDPQRGTGSIAAVGRRPAPGAACGWVDCGGAVDRDGPNWRHRGWSGVLRPKRS
jgi:hypothetical protein